MALHQRGINPRRLPEDDAQSTTARGACECRRSITNQITVASRLRPEQGCRYRLEREKKSHLKFQARHGSLDATCGHSEKGFFLKLYADLEKLIQIKMFFQ